MRAYVGMQGPQRRGRRHAVADATWWMGLAQPEAECGRPGAVDVGEWDPEHPDACPHCLRVIAADAEADAERRRLLADCAPVG